MIKKKTIFCLGLMWGFTVCIFAQVEPKRISNAEVKQMLDQKKVVTIVDVRGINAYKALQALIPRTSTIVTTFF